MKKIVLVIGASSSIGIPLIDKLLCQDFHVVGQYRTLSPKLEAMRQQFPRRLELFNLDFNEENSDKKISELIQLCHSDLFAMVHLPSVMPTIKPLRKSIVNDFFEHFDLQIRSLHSIICGLHKVLSKAEDFRLIGVNTEYSAMQMPPKGLAPYVVAKAAALSYLDCVDAEYREKGVKVNQILPGMFRSPLLKDIPEYVIEGNVNNGSNKNIELCPDKDIASMIAYLLSPAGVNVRGQKIVLQQ